MQVCSYKFLYFLYVFLLFCVFLCSGNYTSHRYTYIYMFILFLCSNYIINTIGRASGIDNEHYHLLISFELPRKGLLNFSWERKQPNGC